MNQISGIRSIKLIGTKNTNNISNLAIFNSVTHVGANPPTLGFMMRPLTVKRDTYTNIKATNYYTINSVDNSMVDDAHQTSAKFYSGISEFDKTELTEEYLGDFPAPFVAESKIKIGLSYVEEHLIKLNQTIFMVGKVEMISVFDDCLEEDGHINHELIKTMGVSGLDTYYSCQEHSRKEFARP